MQQAIVVPVEGVQGSPEHRRRQRLETFLIWPVVPCVEEAGPMAALSSDPAAAAAERERLSV
eukprot:1653089-Pyramimonas_sp.AAC.2